MFCRFESKGYAVINVCMAVRDRFDLTCKTLKSLASSQHPFFLNRLTFTIVDDCSQVDHFKVMKSLPNYHIIRNEESLGVGGSKNLAIEESEKRFGRGDYILISDNDAEWSPKGLETILLAYARGKQEGIRLLGGYAHPFNGTNSLIEAGGFTIHTKNAVDGLSWLLEWETWDKYGKLMDNARGVRQSEDWEYCQRIRNDGFEVGVVFPHVVTNLGLIDTFGDEIPGAQQVREQQGMTA